MNIPFKKGQQYFIKTRHDKKQVRRIFKNTEKRFGEILCYVFTSQVSKSVKCEVEEVGNGVVFYRYSGAKKYPAQEISIPYYDLNSIKEA